MKLQLPDYFHHEKEFGRCSLGLIKNSKKPTTTNKTPRNKTNNNKKPNKFPPTKNPPNPTQALAASPASSLKELGKTRMFSPQNQVN